MFPVNAEAAKLEYIPKDLLRELIDGRSTICCPSKDNVNLLCLCLNSIERSMKKVELRIQGVPAQEE